MYNAKILNNKPLCGKCGSDKLSGVRDWKQVIMDNTSYTMIYVIIAMKLIDIYSVRHYMKKLDMRLTIK